MNLNDMNFPRQLEADGLAEKTREVLAVRKDKLRADGSLEVPVLPFGKLLAGALKKARLQRRLRLGFEDVAEKLAAEKKGITDVLHKTKTQQQDRISRLLLFSNDGAERLNRHIEQILIEHQPRILGCRLDIDGKTLGQFIAGSKGSKGGGIKVILVEHKDAVADILRAALEDSK